MTTQSLTISDRIIRRQMQRAARNCLIAIHTGRLDDGLRAEATFLRLRDQAHAPVTLIEAAS
jgi:hypothetical protein